MRRFALDAVRALAILSVVVCHAVETCCFAGGVAVDPDMWSAVGHVFGRIGVPLFLFLTGALVLRKRFDGWEDVKRFYLRNLLPLLVTAEVWTLVYNVYFAARGSFDALALAQELLFLRLVPLPHWWYVPMILGMYAVLPFVAMVVQRVPARAVALVALVVAVFSLALPTYGYYASAFGLPDAPQTVLETGFYGGKYGLYIVVGYYADQRGLLRRVPSGALLAIAAAAFALCMQIELSGSNVRYDVAWLFVLALVVFEGFLRWERRDGREGPASRPPMWRRAVSWVARVSFGVYLVHELFIPGFTALLGPVGIVPLRVFALAALVLAASVAAVSALQASRRLRLVLFDMR